jgi:lipid A disaccharide synthetase
VTNDKNITAQQNLRGRNIAIIVLPTNRRREVMALAPRIANAIKRVQPGQWIDLDPD